MRIKFEKGFTPEAIAEIFCRYIYDNNIVIGSVNMYVQAYGDDMQAERFNEDDGYVVVKPVEKSKKEYSDYVASVYRGKFKKVSNGS